MPEGKRVPSLSVSVLCSWVFSFTYNTLAVNPHSCWLLAFLDWGPRHTAGQLHRCALCSSGSQSSTFRGTGKARCDVVPRCITDIVAYRPVLALGSCYSRLLLLFFLLPAVFADLFNSSAISSPASCAKGMNYVCAFSQGSVLHISVLCSQSFPPLYRSLPTLCTALCCASSLPACWAWLT